MASTMPADTQRARVGTAFVDTVTGCHFTVSALRRAGVVGQLTSFASTEPFRVFTWREWFSRCRVISEAR